MPKHLGMGRGGRLWRRCGALGAGALLLAACTSGTGDSGDGASPGTTAVTDGQRTVEYLAPEPGEPTPGGTLAYALEADADGFDPTTARWTGPALIMANAVFDPLAAFDVDGAAKPYLAESIEPNDDFTRWTITLRDGVTFQNGEPLDAEALALFITKMRQSPLTGPAIAPIDETAPAVATGPMTVEVSMTEPWATYPVALTGQGGLIPAPEQLTNPDATWRSDNPIGTGPFELREWAKGSRLTLDRNAEYWQDGLPYLETVQFVPMPDNNARDDALLRGDVDMEFTTFSSSVQRLEPLARAGEIQLVLDSGAREQLFLLMNNDKAPFDDERIRRAVALAFDYDAYLEVAREPDAIRSEGPFTRSSPWFVDTDFPTYDLEAAKALVAEYEAEVGPAAFEFRTTDNPENQAIGQSIADMLTAAGMDVTTTSESQTSYPTSIVFGAYELAYVRLFGSPDPDGDAHWFLSENAPPVGQGTIGLNLARMRDEQVDDAIARGRSSTDREERAAAYADLQRRLTEVVPYVWMNESLKYLAADNSVHDFLNGPLPDGTPAMPIVGGVTRLTHTWKS